MGFAVFLREGVGGMAGDKEVALFVCLFCFFVVAGFAVDDDVYMITR